MKRHTITISPIGNVWEWSCSCGAPSAGTKHTGIKRYMESLAQAHVRNARYRASKAVAK